MQLRKRKVLDWKEQLDSELQRLDELEDRIREKQSMIREQAQRKGRLSTQKAIQKIDCTFRPLKLNPDDSKLILHPIDYVVFNGMNTMGANQKIKNIILLDNKKSNSNSEITKSIRNTVEKGNYEWITIRVDEKGKIEIQN